MKAPMSIKDVKLFLLDMDGTIYLGNQIIPGALDFLNAVRSHGKRYLFMTNNSSRGKQAYVDKLNRLGVIATADDIVSSVDVMIRYLNQHKPGAALYLVGTESFKRDLVDAGFSIVPVDSREDDVDFVVMGYDTELNYEKLKGACHYIDNGVDYVATNCDMRCPIENGRYIPDCGSFANMIREATGRMPKFLGKPNRDIVDTVAEQFHVPVESIACVGDRLYTDVQTGINAGCVSICVFSGEATKDDVDKMVNKPSYVFESVRELGEEL